MQGESTTEFKRNIGRNRGKARLWFEGQCLASQGWDKGIRFYTDFQEGSIVYVRLADGETAPRGKRERRVAGTESRPIIDTNTDDILAAFGDDAERVEAKATRGRIMIKRVLAALALASSLFFNVLPADAQRVLVACEFSGVVRDAFRARGHDAISCDVLPTDRPGDHVRGDVLSVLDRDWDLVVAFPPCTFLCASGGGSWRCNPKHDPTGERREKRAEAVRFFCEFLNARCDRVAIENPKSVIPRFVDYRDGRWEPREDYASSPQCPATQMIQPHWFGHPESKETFLWLKNLPKLEPTNVLDIKKHGYYHGGERKWRWQNQTGKGYNKLGQSPDRWKIRSTTYEGIGQAMAERWG